jgi:hypothetical protein
LIQIIHRIGVRAERKVQKEIALKQEMSQSLERLDSNMPRNQKVRITTKGNGWISLSPIEAQPEPMNLSRLKGEVMRRWPMTSLLDILKETDLRINFTDHFKTAGVRRRSWRNP